MKIAVIGGGISGLAAALILNQEHEVHLFESDSRLGGHAHTVSVNEKSKEEVAIDTGFLVYNTLTYPHFTQFLKYLEVATTESNMSLSIQAIKGLEWAGENLSTVFAQPKNILNLDFLKMLIDIWNFNKSAKENLELSREKNFSLEELADFRGYSHSFKTLYLLPMTGAIWSMSYANALKFPAETFLTFCINHHLLQINDRPVWRTITGGSINYVDRVRERLQHIHASTKVKNIARNQDKLTVITENSKIDFDKVILATHAPTSASLISSDFPDMAAELSCFKVTPNKVELHEDESLMPKNKSCWSAWNVKAQDQVHDKSDICLTYFINKLQPLPVKKNYFVTLNYGKTLQQKHREFNYDHPQFDFSTIETQKKIPQIQGRHGIYFAGAWTRYGFHEDGILSAVNVAKLLGVEPPWS